MGRDRTADPSTAFLRASQALSAAEHAVRQLPDPGDLLARLGAAQAALADALGRVARG